MLYVNSKVWFVCIQTSVCTNNWNSWVICTVHLNSTWQGGKFTSICIWLLFIIIGVRDMIFIIFWTLYLNRLLYLVEVYHSIALEYFLLSFNFIGNNCFRVSHRRKRIYIFNKWDSYCELFQNCVVNKLALLILYPFIYKCNNYRYH